MPRNHKNNVKTGLRLKEKLPKEKRAEESQEQRKNRLAAQREITEKIMPRNHKNNVKTGLRIKEIIPKESVPRNHKSNVKNYRLVFRYSPVDDYSLSRCVQIGTTSKICPYCKALKFNGKNNGNVFAPQEKLNFLNWLHQESHWRLYDVTDRDTRTKDDRDTGTQGI